MMARINLQQKGCYLIFPGFRATHKLHMNTNTIEKQIEIKAPRARVWRALTTHTEFAQWFGAALTSPFVVGQVSAGVIQTERWGDIDWKATVQKIEPESYFALTWHPFSLDKAVDYSKEIPTLVEFRLRDTAGGTLLTVKESGFDEIPAERRMKAFDAHTGGWEMQLQNIQEHVEKA
jgi:uncharacterized protein YndB with AHSA1/START domain